MTTQWTQILSSQRTSSGTHSQALTLLCNHYHRPVYLYIVRQGNSAHDAEDLTQSFFASLAEKNSYRLADRERGKFRTFLLSSVKNFLHEQHRFRNRQKRGGEFEHLALDHPEAPALADPDPTVDDSYFDHEWAAQVFDTVWNLIQEEYEQAGELARYKLLRQTLTTPDNAIPYEELAQELDLTINGVRSATFRLRSRFRELFRVAVAQIVENPSDVDQEVRYLLEVLIRNSKNAGPKTA